MGKFSDRVRKIFNPAKQEQVEFNRSVGLNDDARLITIDQMQKPHDAYFIRKKNQPDQFVKFKDGEYWFGDGPVMGCMWTMKTGLEFIKATPKYELEMVRMDQVLKQ